MTKGMGILSIIVVLHRHEQPARLSGSFFFLTDSQNSHISDTGQ